MENQFSAFRDVKKTQNQKNKSHCKPRVVNIAFYFLPFFPSYADNAIITHADSTGKFDDIYVVALGAPAPGLSRLDVFPLMKKYLPFAENIHILNTTEENLAFTSRGVLCHTVSKKHCSNGERAHITELITDQTCPLPRRGQDLRRTIVLYPFNLRNHNEWIESGVTVVDWKPPFAFLPPTIYSDIVASEECPILDVDPELLAQVIVLVKMKTGSTTLESKVLEQPLGIQATQFPVIGIMSAKPGTTTVNPTELAKMVADNINGLLLDQGELYYLGNELNIPGWFTKGLKLGCKEYEYYDRFTQLVREYFGTFREKCPIIVSKVLRNHLRFNQVCGKKGYIDLIVVWRTPDAKPMQHPHVVTLYTDMSVDEAAEQILDYLAVGPWKQNCTQSQSLTLTEAIQHVAKSHKFNET